MFWDDELGIDKSCANSILNTYSPESGTTVPLLVRDADTYSLNCTSELEYPPDFDIWHIETGSDVSTLINDKNPRDIFPGQITQDCVETNRYAVSNEQIHTDCDTSINSKSTGHKSLSVYALSDMDLWWAL